MRGVGKRGMAAALVLGLAVSVAAAQDKDDGPKPANSWWTGWFGGKDKPEAKREAAEKPTPPPSVVERAETVRQRELKSYLRRIEVCDKLAQIAEDKNDQDMLSKVEDMKEEVWAVYQRRTANLTAGAAPLDTDDVRQEGSARKPAFGRSRDEGRRAAASREEKP